MPDRENLLEVGLLGSVGVVLAALSLLAVGALVGRGRSARRRRRGAPSPGSVPGERHQHVGAVSAR